MRCELQIKSIIIKRIFVADQIATFRWMHLMCQYGVKTYIHGTKCDRLNANYTVRVCVCLFCVVFISCSVVWFGLVWLFFSYCVHAYWGVCCLYVCKRFGIARSLNDDVCEQYFNGVIHSNEHTGKCETLFSTLNMCGMR